MEKEDPRLWGVGLEVGEGGGGSCCLTGRVPIVQDDDDILETDGGNGHAVTPCTYHH